MQTYNVFDSAKHHEDGKGQFDDSTTKFYKFLSDKCNTDDTSTTSSKPRWGMVGWHTSAQHPYRSSEHVANISVVLLKIIHNNNCILASLLKANLVQNQNF